MKINHVAQVMPETERMGAKTPEAKLRVLFLIRSLEQGGAQRQLVELVRALAPERFEIMVVTFYDGGQLGEHLADKRLVSLRKRSRWHLLPVIARLVRIAREFRPDVVHGYMGIANELAMFTAKVVGARSVIGLRETTPDFSKYDWASAVAFRIGAWLSRCADLIIVNSHAGRNSHISQGYAASRMVVLHNGIDTNSFRPDRLAGRAFREKWGIPVDAPVVGLVARLDPMKDHMTFLKAVACLLKRHEQVYFVCVGGGPAPYREQLQAYACSLGVDERVIWTGACDSMRDAYNALDLVTMSSAFGEGFPNAIGEAMACGIPCVATDVGDCARIVPSSEMIVPPGNPEALAAAWERYLLLSGFTRRALSELCRERIVGTFGVDQLASRTGAALWALKNGEKRP